MYQGTDTVVLYDELAYEDVLPVLWRPSSGPPDPAAAGRFDEANLRLLQACAIMDEPLNVPREKLDENAPLAAEIARLDLKLTLLLDLVVHIASRDLQRPEPTPVRFNAIGATFRGPRQRPELGSAGVTHIFLRSSLPQPLSLPARVAAVDDAGQMKVRFLPMSEPVADLIEKLAFRRHRRHVAEARRPR